MSEKVNVSSESIDTYDAGLLGGDTSWPVEYWHDYLRSELARAHEFYAAIIEQERHQAAVYQKAAATASSDASAYAYQAEQHCDDKENLRQRAEAAEAALQSRFVELLAVFRAADDERHKETAKAYQEAEKWKSEGDMYGWNFHQGRSGGITWGSIVFFKVQRAIEALIVTNPKK